MLTKNELRKYIKQEKQAHTDSWLKEQSEKILHLVEQHPAFQSAGKVLLYHSLPDEVDTHSFLERWEQSKDLLLPVVKGDYLEISHYSTHSGLRKGAYGISEPNGCTLTNLHEIDLVLVPGVAFDREGHRLGRGKGYYDRLLPQLRARKIGVCFPFQLLDSLPVEPFDVSMDEVITT